jgi:hypothetical protein
MSGSGSGLHQLEAPHPSMSWRAQTRTERAMTGLIVLALLRSGLRFGQPTPRGALRGNPLISNVNHRAVNHLRGAIAAWVFNRQRLDINRQHVPTTRLSGGTSHGRSTHALHQHPSHRGRIRDL